MKIFQNSPKLLLRWKFNRHIFWNGSKYLRPWNHMEQFLSVIDLYGILIHLHASLDIVMDVYHPWIYRSNSSIQVQFDSKKYVHTFFISQEWQHLRILHSK